MTVLSCPLSRMTESEERSHKNPYDESPKNEEVVTEKGEINPAFALRIRSTTDALLHKLTAAFDEKESEDYTVYTGTCGVAFLYLLLASNLEKNEYYKKGLNIVKASFPKLKSRCVSFLNGDSGPLALGAVFYDRLGIKDESKKLIKRIEEMLPIVTSTNSDLPDEILFGRSGYLYALLFINKYISEDSIEPEVFTKVVSAILESGKNFAASKKKKLPLLYAWHDEYYLGAAHGMAGIMYMLLKARKYLRKEDRDNLIRPTIDFLLTTTFPSGNFRPSIESKEDRLVQWCHGAPGMVDLFVLAFKVYSDELYLHAAFQCAEVVWKYGILKKSYGICHGVSGNGYTFLTLYNATKDPTLLYRACKFAEWCTSYGKFQSRNPDRPLSLFEGVAGAIYFLVDILNPEKALFPAYCL